MDNVLMNPRIRDPLTKLLDEIEARRAYDEQIDAQFEGVADRLDAEIYRGMSVDLENVFLRSALETANAKLQQVDAQIQQIVTEGAPCCMEGSGVAPAEPADSGFYVFFS